MELSLMQSMLKKHEREKNVVKVLSMRSESAVGKNENFLSQVLRTKCTLLLGSGKKTTKSFIVKYIPGVGRIKKVISEMGIFKKEISVYSDILYQMESLMDDYKDPSDNLWCEMIGFRRNDIIILEDLSEKNFMVANRKEMLDWDCAELGIRSIARFHALSTVLLRNGQVSLDDYSRYIVLEEKQCKTVISSFIDFMAGVVECEWGDDWAEYPDKLRNLSADCYRTFSNLYKLDKSKFNVINHGDPWTNNLMFKFDTDHKPTALRFLDFQFTHFNSFGWDLTYFMHNSVKKSVRLNRYNELIESYYDTLSRTMLFYHTPENEIPSFESLLEEMERLRIFGLALLFSIGAITSSDKEDVDVEKNFISTKLYTKPRFMENVQEDMIQCSQLGIF